MLEPLPGAEDEDDDDVPELLLHAVRASAKPAQSTVAESF
jgi:hypothetical protein